MKDWAKMTPKQRKQKQFTYFCEDCGATFDEDQADWSGSYEGEGVMRGWMWDEMICPKCGSHRIEEGYICWECEKCCYEDEIFEGEDGHFYCEECMKEIEEEEGE